MRMVQGLNWNNYSANQIVEMKNSGIEVPKDVYEKAEAALSEQDSKEVTAQGNDNSDVQYTIQDSSGEFNEAEQMAQEMEAQLGSRFNLLGANLSHMVQQFTDICNNTNNEMKSNIEELNSMVSYVTVTQTETEQLNQEVAAEEADLQEVVDDFTEELEVKEEEMEALTDKVEDGTATEEEQAKAEQLGEEIGELVDDGNAEIQAKQETVNNVKTSVLTQNKDMAQLAQNLGKKINDAGNAKEIATKTNELSQELYERGKKTATVASFFSVFGLGFMIGGLKQMKTAQQGIMTSGVLTANATQTTAMAAKVAEQNNININSNQILGTAADELGAEVNTTTISTDKDGAEKTDDVAQQSSENISVGDNADENKKEPVKKEV